MITTKKTCERNVTCNKKSLRNLIFNTQVLDKLYQTKLGPVENSNFNLLILLKLGSNFGLWLLLRRNKLYSKIYEVHKIPKNYRPYICTFNFIGSIQFIKHVRFSENSIGGVQSCSFRTSR